MTYYEYVLKWDTKCSFLISTRSFNQRPLVPAKEGVSGYGGSQGRSGSSAAYNQGNEPLALQYKYGTRRKEADLLVLMEEWSSIQWDVIGRSVMEWFGEAENWLKGSYRLLDIS